MYTGLTAGYLFWNSKLKRVIRESEWRGGGGEGGGRVHMSVVG